MNIIITISLHVVVTLLFLSVTAAVLPNGQCSVDGMTCEFANENLVGLIDGVMSAEECKQECENNSTECRIYSYYGANGAPFSDSCLLFKECTVLDPVDECFTEDIQCVIFCNAPVEGQLGDNLIDIVAGVSEAACEAECEVVEQCQFFTFHFSNSTLYPSTCFLLSEIQEPIIACQNETCITGSSKCENSVCGFLENGVLFPSGIIVTETTEVDMLTIGPCSSTGAVAVVVGGGGTSSSDAGSGSGFVEFKELTPSDSGPYMKFTAVVGSAGEASELLDRSNGLSILKALPGNDGRGGDGASGYSGGGADGLNALAGDGGTDGGDGSNSADYDGGFGSGLDIRTIPLKNFELR